MHKLAYMRRVHLGLLVPSSNTVLEPLTYAILGSIKSDKVSVSVHFSRFRATTVDPSEESDAQFEYGPILAAARLLTDANVDVIGWSGTSAGWLGFEHDERLCAVIEAATGVKATTSVLSLNEIFRNLCCTSFGLITPYVKELSDQIRSNYAETGIDISNNWESHLSMTKTTDFADVDEETLDRMVTEVTSNGAHVLSTFCTNLRAAQRVDHWERSSRIIVADTVSALIWGMLKAVDVDTRLVKGWGFIFEVE